MNEYSFKDIYVGLSESFSLTVTEKHMEQFLNLSGDINPLHTDRDYSLSKGFIDKVVYGMLTSSFYSTLAGVYLPGKYCLLQGIDISFHNAAFIGDNLTISGEVTYINEAYKQIEIKAVIINQENKKISKAKIKAGLNE